ncbi:hypothetical protein B0H14DRAFT_3435242 [Mycena olivaceomarginata]|nr:hypothetical protein B0H14DRAFT_3435242 [Mycena olivaceomarginata]
MAATSSSILLSNGTVLIHDEEDHLTPVKADILIAGNKIVEIAPSVAPSSDTIHIDCTGKIVSPGFVDTHHHVWQTQLKGRHADDLLLDYMVKGNFVYSMFSPEDVFWGELGGCMESIDAGTTMVVDHAHMNYSAEHSSSALSATCRRLPSPRWRPIVLGPTQPIGRRSNWLISLQTNHLGTDACRLGVAFDAYYLPKDVVVSLFEKARGLGVKLFTSHYVRGPLGAQSFVDILDSYGLLKDDILLSHANQAKPEDAVKLVAKHAHISSTPDTELQTAIGTPVCFRPDLHKISSLGIDCHSNNSADMLSQMRLALQSARGTHNQRFIAEGKLPRTVNATAEQAFNLATIMGARAVGMEAEIGSLAVGKLADIVIFDAQSPGMICAAEHDPVAAIVLHASVRDIETVIVDGRIQKHKGKLVPVEVENKMMEWPQVAAKLLDSRQRLQDKLEAVDMDSAKKAVIELFRIDERIIVDNP